jgi:hypothetical protein
LIYVKVMETILFPWKLGSFNARPQELSGTLKSFSRPVKKVSKMLSILRNAVGNITFEMPPNKFVRIKFRRVSGKTVCMNTPLGFNEPLNRARLVDGAGIPDQDKALLKVSEKMPQESQDFKTADIPRHMEASVQIDPPLPGRNADRGDGRDFRPSSGDFKNRRFPNRRPSLSDARNKAKPALVEENQGNIKFSGLFLYVAKYDVSTVLSSSRHVLSRVSQAFDDSSPTVSKTTRDDWGDKTLRSVFGPPRRFSGLSRDQWNNPVSWALPQESLSVTASGARLTSQDVQELVLTSSLQTLFFDGLFAIDGQNLRNNRFSRQQPADLILYPAAQQRSGASVRDAFGFHVVSWNHNNIFRNTIPLLLRYSII